MALLLPGAGAAATDVNCTVASVRFDPLNKTLPLEAPQHARGWVDVTCANPSPLAQEVELGLMLAGGDDPVDGEGGAVPRHPVRVELFSDEGLRMVLPSWNPAAIEAFTRLAIEGAGESRVSIPLHARVAIRNLVEAGSYTISRDIRLVVRSGSSR